MKKTVTREVTCCDKCAKEYSYPKTCRRCGMEVCYECADVYGVTYSAGVYGGGSGDSFYCRPCDITLCESNDDPLHLAYRAVRALRDEDEAIRKEFKRRKEMAEGRLGVLIEKAGLR